MLIKILIITLLPINLASFSLNDPQDWIGITDQVMGGVSDLTISHSDGVFFMKGNVSTDNNGGFVRLSNRLAINSNEFKGIKFKAKGNNEKYEIHVTLKGLKSHHGLILAKVLMSQITGRSMKSFFQI